LESAEKIVELYARHLKGLATIANIGCDGAREINLLAIDPAIPTRRFHIEVSVAPAAHAVPSSEARGAFDEFIARRFNSKAVSKKLRQYGFEPNNYQKVVVALTPTPAIRAAADDAGVELWSFKSLSRELAKRFKQNPTLFSAAELGSLDRPAKTQLDPGSFANGARAQSRLSVVELWNTRDAKIWDRHQGELYDTGGKPGRRDLERQLETPGLRARIARMNAADFYDFLRDEYFPSKITVKSQFIGALKGLAKHVSEGSMERVERARLRLVNRVYDSKAEAIGMLMGEHGGIHGVTVAGASGLLALVYPEEFAPVDAVVTKALQQIVAPEAARPNPKDVSIAEAEMLIEVMRTKALELNRAFGVSEWTPRRVARVLSVAGR
jgi:hypothetical protein